MSGYWHASRSRGLCGSSDVADPEIQMADRCRSSLHSRLVPLNLLRDPHLGNVKKIAIIRQRGRTRRNLEVVDFLMPFGLLLLSHAAAFFSEVKYKIGHGKGDTARRKNAITLRAASDSENS